MCIPDNIVFRNGTKISALSNWEAHTSATEGEARCERIDDCPFMGKMPGLVKISLGGASGGNDNNDDIDKDENKEFNEVDPNKDIDADADLESQAGGVNETENCTEYELLITHDEDEPRNDAEDEVEKICCLKYCCFL